MAEKDKSYNIKVPVYTSERIDDAKGMFGGITKDDMINFVKRKITDYNLQDLKVTSDKRNKTKKKEIGSVDFFDYKLGNDPALLLKITASDTNLYDGFYKGADKIQFDKDDKIGSDNNFVLLFPNIIGIDLDNLQYHWMMLIYEDPHKENSDVVNTVKLVLRKILDITPSNVKLKHILEEVRKEGKIPELQMRYSTLNLEDSDIESYMEHYFHSGKLRKTSETIFRDVPAIEIEKLLKEKSEDGLFKKTIKLISGKREYRITKEMKDIESKIKETSEEIFNSNVLIYDSEMDNIFNPDFIIKKLAPVLDNYLYSHIDE